MSTCIHCKATFPSRPGPEMPLCPECCLLAGVRPRKERQAPKPKRGPRPDRSRYFTLAHAYVDIAVRNGDLPKLDGSVACVDCGAPACEYDHRDYKKPMDVEPVCRACNQARGPGLHRDPSETGTKPLTIRQRFNKQEAA